MHFRKQLQTNTNYQTSSISRFKLPELQNRSQKQNKKEAKDKFPKLWQPLTPIQHFSRHLNSVQSSLKSPFNHHPPLINPSNPTSIGFSPFLHPSCPSLHTQIHVTTFSLSLFSRSSKFSIKITHYTKFAGCHLIKVATVRLSASGILLASHQLSKTKRQIEMQKSISRARKRRKYSRHVRVVFISAVLFVVLVGTARGDCFIYLFFGEAWHHHAGTWMRRQHCSAAKKKKEKMPWTKTNTAHHSAD